MKRFVQLAIGLVVSAVFLWLALRDVALADVRERVASADPLWLVAVVVTAFLSIWSRGQRWRYLFVHLQPIEVKTLAASQAVGFAANTIFPFRAGEAIKAYSIARKTGLPFSTTIASVVLERVFDMVAVGCFLTAALWLVPVPESASTQVSAAIRLLGVVAATVTLMVAALIVWRERMLAWIDRALAFLPLGAARTVRSTVVAVVASLDALTDMRQLFLLIVYSLWVWITLALPYGMTAVALGLHVDPGVPLVSFSIVSVTLVAVFVMIPAAPGFIGTFQAGCVLALGVFGVGRTEAIGFSLLLHALTFVPPTILGVVLLIREGLRPSMAREAGETASTAGSGRADVV